MDFRPKRGFALTELVVVMILVAIISTAGAALMGYLIQNAAYIPNKINMDMLAFDALDIMIEGDSVAKGLRFSRAISAVAVNTVTFINQDSQTIRFRLDTVTHKLYRQINSGTEKVIPYYGSLNGLSVYPTATNLFTYYDANQAVTSTPANVRWVTLGLKAQTGDGLFNHWEGKASQTTAIAVKRYQ
jgi:prepilin-type N-terminal cleavage/methylation domain-containing protein